MSIQEWYERAGVIHSEDCCQICLEENKNERVSMNVNKILYTLVAMGVGVCIGLVIAWQPLPLERLHRDYSYIQIYEDGSYVAETREGQPERGCILTAQCNESSL